MRKPLQIIYWILWAAALLSRADVREFRLDRDRLWLSVDGEPLSQLLEQFAQAGVRVEIDPEAQKTITGSWQNEDAETVLRTVLFPLNYRLDWQRESGPLGPMTRLTGIRVFRADRAGTVEPLRPTRRIETSLDGTRRYLARELLIGFKQGASLADLHALLARMGGTVIAVHPELGVYRILLPEGANVLALLDELQRDGRIALVEPNYIYDLPGLLPGEASSPTDPTQWEAPSSASPIAVAVLDSGLAASSQLAPAILSAFDATRPGTPLTADAVGHGTLMAQLAAGLLDPYGNSVSEGVPVVAIKAFADDGSADSFTLMSAMSYALENSTGPISLSWGSETPSAFIETAMSRAIAGGALIFAAVGNEPSGKPMYPAACPGVIGVAASSGGQLADYSNRGSFVDFVVPGAAGGSQGTSVSTAALAHVAARYQRLHPEATSSDVITALKSAAGPSGFLSMADVARLLVR